MGIRYFIIDLNSVCDCVFVYCTRIVLIIEVFMYDVKIIWLRCIIIPFVEIILCTCIDMRLSISWARGDRSCWGWWDVKIVIWARVDHPCEIFWYSDNALRSSAQTRGDRLCRYMELASPPWIMRSRFISEEYHVYTVEWVLGILRQFSTWYHIALHFITSVILDGDVFLFGIWKVLDVWLPLLIELN